MTFATERPSQPLHAGKAVYYWPYAGSKHAERPYFAAVVVRCGVGRGLFARLAIQFPEGRKMVTNCNQLVYRSQCERCAVPTVIDGQRLVCPSCGHVALDAPPPLMLTERWFDVRHMHDPFVLRDMILTGCTRQDVDQRWWNYFCAREAAEQWQCASESDGTPRTDQTWRLVSYALIELVLLALN